MALKDCPDEEDLNIFTDSLSAMVLLRGMQRKDLPVALPPHGAPVAAAYRSAYQ